LTVSFHPFPATNYFSATKILGLDEAPEYIEIVELAIAKQAGSAKLAVEFKAMKNDGKNLQRKLSVRFKSAHVVDGSQAN
jgi:hypothetical protein